MNVPFRTKRMLNFGDCDISGTAYYPAYLNILNNVNEEFWEHLGWTWYQIMIKERWGTPTVHLSCDFSVPSYFGQELDFEVRVLKVGRSSLTLHHTVSYNGETRWKSKQVLAASDIDKHNSIPWPDDVRAALEACITDLPEWSSADN